MSPGDRYLRKAGVRKAARTRLPLETRRRGVVLRSMFPEKPANFIVRSGLSGGHYPPLQDLIRPQVSQYAASTTTP